MLNTRGPEAYAWPRAPLNEVIGAQIGHRAALRCSPPTVYSEGTSSTQAKMDRVMVEHCTCTARSLS